MRTRYDQFGKQVVRETLVGWSPVETDAEVSVDPRRIDLWCALGSRRDPAADDLDLLGRITVRPCTLEFFHCTPDGEELASCLIKHGNFRHFLSLRKPAPPRPVHWVISSGRPDTGIEDLCFHADPRWPSGIYRGPRELWTYLCVVSELPVRRDTLLLRLFGAGRVLKQAIAELKALPQEARERLLALPILLRLRLEIPADPHQRTSDDQEFLMDTQDIVENWRQEAIQEGVKRGVEAGRAEGLRDGHRRLLLKLLTARFGALPHAATARVNAATLSELEAWAERVITAPTLDAVLGD